jgi:hypothetical protein
MKPSEASLTELDVLTTLWWLWRTQKISIGDVKFYVEDLDLGLEFITLNGYKFTNTNKKIIYSYDRKQKKDS